MAVVKKSLRIPDRILKEIERMAQDAQRDFSSVANELLEEAVKTHRCPGIVFSEGVRGRRARVAGTGVEVWEIVATYKGLGRNLGRLRKTYHWLTDQQLRSAIGYYESYSEEIDRLIAANENWTPESVRKTHPFLPTGRTLFR
jgi:uncharacterized protein (DUF433 family)